jgi:hypothetical protein
MQESGVAGSPMESAMDTVLRGMDSMFAAQKEIVNNSVKTSKSIAAKA